MRLQHVHRGTVTLASTAAILGNLITDFNFSQAPRKPLLLPTNPPTDSPTVPVYFRQAPPCAGCTTPPPIPRQFH